MQSGSQELFSLSTCILFTTKKLLNSETKHMWHGGGGWFQYMRSGDEKPKVTRELLLRVLTYAREYWWHIAGMLVTILLTTGLSLFTPLIFRNMIDVVLPAKDTRRLIWLGVALLAIPILQGGINVIQRRLNAAVGEGVIYD